MTPSFPFLPLIKLSAFNLVGNFRIGARLNQCKPIKPKRS
jgi:hypothetical protein